MGTLEERFFQLFAGLDRAYGEYKLSGSLRDGVKAEGRASTIKGNLSLIHWERHLAGRVGLGIIPITDNATAHWGAIDIDVYPVDFDALQSKIDTLKIPLIICKSKSGGAHIYLFLKEACPATLIRGKMMAIASAMGYPKVEIYPKQVRLASNRDIGNWLNMPYFGGDKSSRVALHEGKPLNMLDFLDLAESKQLSLEELDTLSAGTDAFSDGPPCLQAMATTGFPQGSRNNALFSVAVYLRNKHPDDWAGKLLEVNQQYMSPPLNVSEVMLIERSAKRKDYAYRCQEQPIVDYCNKDICKHRKYGIGNINEEDLLTKYNFGSITKIKTNPPLWVFEVNASRIELETDELMDFRKFRKRFFEFCDILMPMIKQPVWEKLLDEKMQTVDYIGAPDDADDEGRLWSLVKSFCVDGARATSRDDVAMGRPYFDDTRRMIMFKGDALKTFLNRHQFRQIQGKDVWAVLRRRGADYKQIKIGGTVVNVWMVPEFDVQNVPFDTPDIKEDF